MIDVLRIVALLRANQGPELFARGLERSRVLSRFQPQGAEVGILGEGSAECLGELLSADRRGSPVELIHGRADLSFADALQSKLTDFADALLERRHFAAENVEWVR